MKARLVMRRCCAAVLAWSLLLSVECPAHAQPCIGDCRALGQVGISDLVLAVNIALGNLPLGQCPALGPGPVSIATLIASVNNALCACRSCPTPRPTVTATRSATPTLSPTPTATPTPAPTVSSWREDNLKLTFSTCPRAINDALRRGLSGQAYDYTVRQLDEQIEIDDGSGSVVRGTIDADGDVDTHEVVRQSEGSCVVTFDFTRELNLSQSPTTSRHTAWVSSMGCPNDIFCRLVITSRWTRTAPAAALRRTGAGAVDIVVRDAVSP